MDPTPGYQPVPTPSRQVGARVKIVSAVAAVILAAAVAFGIHVAVDRSRASAAPARTTAVNAMANGPGSSTAGTVAKVDGTTLTLTEADGSTITVATSGDTAFTTSMSGTLHDVKAGDRVSISGSTGTSTDVVTAARITDSGTLALDQPGAHGGGADGTGGPEPADGAPPSSSMPAGGPDGSGLAPQDQGQVSSGPNRSGSSGAAASPARPVNGTVTSVADGVLVVADDDGTSVTVTVSSSTSVQLVAAGDLTSIATGDTITVRGMAGNDGIIAATSVRKGARTVR